MSWMYTYRRNCLICIRVFHHTMADFAFGPDRDSCGETRRNRLDLACFHRWRPGYNIKGREKTPLATAKKLLRKRVFA